MSRSKQAKQTTRDFMFQFTNLRNHYFCNLNTSTNFMNVNRKNVKFSFARYKTVHWAFYAQLKLLPVFLEVQSRTFSLKILPTSKIYRRLWKTCGRNLFPWQQLPSVSVSGFSIGSSGRCHRPSSPRQCLFDRDQARPRSVDAGSGR